MKGFLAGLLATAALTLLAALLAPRWEGTVAEQFQTEGVRL